MEATAQTPPATAKDISTAGTLRRISETVLSILHNRFELVTLELKEEKHWAVATLMCAIMAASLAVSSIVAVLVTVGFLVPPEARPWVMIGICVVTIGGCVACVLVLKAKLKRPPMLADTLAELKKDIECLKEN
ncbi:MAG TPA: phage holin family protein [Methylomirabilota bacterium]|nr:phage holin family protein [Methylomirabilota bacterium]